MTRFTGNAWHVADYFIAEYELGGRLVYGFGVGAHDMHPGTVYDTVERALAEAMAFKLTGVEPRAFGPGTGSAAQWFLAACAGAAALAAASR